MPTAASSRFSAFAPANVTGADVITPCSLPAAMMDPEKVTPPMITSRRVVTDVVVETLAPAVM